jgi:hypothetical protein
MRRALRACAVLVSLIVSGCGGGQATASANPTAAPSSLPTADLAHPVGVIAMGHSGLTGEGTGELGAANFDGSWATGTLPQVNSIYMRLAAARPETLGHVDNEAVGAAPAAALLGQAKAALAKVPAPALAIIQTVDNDIQCEPTNADAVAASVTQALQEIHTASPNTKILVVGQAGRPSVAFIQALVAAHPEVKADLTGTDACAFYSSDGSINEAGFTELTASIDAYEAAVAKACAGIPGCATDGGVRRTWVDKIELFGPDLNHLNLQGQAAVAEQLWPVVETLLGL